MPYVTHIPQAVAMAADVHNLQMQGTRIDLTPDQANRALTGIKPGSIAGNGTEICINNCTGFAINLPHNSNSSDADARLKFPDGLDGTLPANEMVWAIYQDGVGWKVQF